MSTGATKQRARQGDLPTMEDRRNQKIHGLAERWTEITQAMRTLKGEKEEVSVELARALHDSGKTVYRYKGIVVTLEEVEKVKVTTGKSGDEEED
jgi:hypothetical protein